MEDIKKLVEEHGSIQGAADALGIPRTTLRDRLRRSLELEDNKVEMPVFPESDLPITDVIDFLSKKFEKRQKSYEAHTWYPIKIRSNDPIGILWFGDPHLGDSGCNLPALLKHIEICSKTSGMYGANIGDSSNNWSGKLSHLYAEQDTSRKTERRLVEWFMCDAGVPWLVWLIGNHDAWGDGAEIIARMTNRYGTQKIILHDWEARFSIPFPNGWEPRVYAAHNFRGSSMWNKLQGPMREAAIGQDADLFICGHLHEWAVGQQENPHRGKIQHFVRVRGYKSNDDYARRLGIVEQNSGQSILTIFDPRKKKIYTFEDIEAGAEFLELIRKK